MQIEREFSECLECDVSGNEIQYKLEPSVCPPPPSIFELDTTGIIELWEAAPGAAGGYFYNPDRFNTRVFRGIALWVSTGGTSRELLHVWQPSDFTPGDILDYSSIIKGYSAPGVARTIFFTGLWLTGNGGDPLHELPTQPVIETSSGAIGVSNIANINAAIQYYVFIGLYHTPFTFLRWANNMGTLTIGNVTTDAARTRLNVFMESLPPTA